MVNDKIICGVVGTAIGAAGAGLSVTEIQAIVSIVITILGFTISVLVPFGIKIYHKIKEKRESSKKEEVSEKSEGEKK